MDKDVIIGAASNYDWSDLEPWVTSIKESGFKGQLLLCGSNMSKDTVDELVAQGVTLSMYGKQAEDGSFSHTPGNAPHVERFFQIYNALQMMEDQVGSSVPPTNLRYVVTTDTRDVVFQSDPMEYMDFVFSHYPDRNLIATSEGLHYKNEPWGNQNLLETFGPHFHNMLKDEMIHNVGVMGGRFKYVKAMMLNIFQMSVNRPIPIVDQAVFNYLIALEPWKSMVYHDAGEWCVNLGTTEAAIKEGNGDIGLLAASDPSYMAQYRRNYQLQQPQLDGDLVVDHAKNSFTIVHQYDRIGVIDRVLINKFRK